VPEKHLLVTPGVEAQLYERQRDMVSRLVGGEELTSRKCQELYKLSPQAVYEDFQKLVGLGIARKIGSGRATRLRVQPSSLIINQSSTHCP
jgi:predicted DNA-binding transcriptional regulator YafY